jgi:radical SAM superfamily enzyme with C-terminal helix-hairpin-helix motif
VTKSIRIKDTPLSERAIYVITHTLQVHTVAALRARLEREADIMRMLLRIPNMGHKTAQEIITYVYTPKLHALLALQRRRKRCLSEIDNYARQGARSVRLLAEVDAELKIELEAELKQQEDNQ